MNPNPPTDRGSRLGLESLELRNSLERKLFGETAITHVGRYEIEGRLGSGAMGTVFRARDPALSRTVAVKVLASAATPSNRDAFVEALLAEAKTLAQLSHPNVVAVHDVGTHDGHVFIAMECVEGITLREWYRSSRGQRRRLETGVRLLEQAARGLAAAHALGIIHRDFKPENVLIGDDGRVRVVDFGLAVSPQTAPDLEATISGEVDDPLATGAGEIVGTPAYMAPEQFSGRHVTAAADQFALCTALFELVCGRRPHEDSKTVSALAAAVIDGSAVIPRDASVARGLRTVIERGLARAPEARYPSMDALIEALERQRQRPKRILTGALVVAAAVGGAGAAWAAGEPGANCSEVGSAAEEVWSPSRDAEMIAAFDNTGLPFAGAEGRRLGDALQAYVAKWKGAREQACEATYVLQQRSPELHDLEVACLDRSLADVAARVDVYIDANNIIVERAARLAAALPDIEQCSRADKLMAQTPAPEDEAEASLSTEVNAAANRANALVSADRFDAARELLAPLEPRVETSAHAPTQAAWFASSSIHYLSTGNVEQFRTQARKAFHAAVASGADEMAGRVATRLAGDARISEDGRAARDWASTALSLARRQGGNVAIEIRALNVLAQVEVIDGNDAEGEALFERALRIASEQGLDAAYTTVLSDSAAVYSARGDTERAVSLYERARERTIEDRGLEHSSVFHETVNLGMVLYVSGQTERGEALLREGVAGQEAIYGPMYFKLVYPLRVLADAHMQRSEHEEAVALRLRMLDIQTETYGLDSWQVASVRASYAAGLADLGRGDEAAKQVELASVGARNTLEPGSWELAHRLVVLATAQVEASPAQARALAIEVQEILDTPKGSAGSPYNLANTYWSLILLFNALEEPERAVATGAAVVLAMDDAPKFNQGQRALILMEYARALEKNDRLDDAMTLAREAVALLREDGDLRPVNLQEAEAWVREHGG